MEVTTKMIDKVVFYKGRVWTIYGTSKDGAFAFNGLKPYTAFKFDSYNNYHGFNSTYIPSVDIQIIEGAEIERFLKIEKAAEKKKINKKYAIEFFSWLTGHTKGFVSKHLEERYHGFYFTPGWICYEIWKMDGILYLSHSTENGYSSLAYFDFVTWEPDDRHYEKNKRANEEDVVDRYRESIIAEYKKEKGIG